MNLEFFIYSIRMQLWAGQAAKLARNQPVRRHSLRSCGKRPLGWSLLTLKADAKRPSLCRFFCVRSTTMLPLEKLYDHGPAAALKREVLQLIDFQIETLKQESTLDHSELHDYQARSERIRMLYGELDRIRRVSG